MQGVIPSLASLCEGGGPAGPEGENLATARNVSDNRKVLSPTACGRSPLAEGAKVPCLPLQGRWRRSAGRVELAAAANTPGGINPSPTKKAHPGF